MERLVLILGMHRSGTSVTTGILNRLGLPLGENLMPPTKDNPKGYFENMDFYWAHKLILHKHECHWDNVDKLITSPEVLLDEANKHVLKILIDKYSNHKIFGVKDPRVCVLLPLYEEVCNELGIELDLIYVKRDKEAIIKSITKRDNLSYEHVENLISSYLFNVESKKNIVTFQYEDLLENPKSIIDILLNNFSFLDKEKIDFSMELIDKSLNRNG